MTTMTLTVEAEIELLGFSMGQLMTVADKGNIGFQGSSVPQVQSTHSLMTVTSMTNLR